MSRINHRQERAIAPGLTRLIEALRQGEVLAARIAQRQSDLAPVPWMRRALAVQAAQERSHAAIAGIAVRLLGPVAGAHRDAPDVIAGLRRQLERDLDAGRLACSMIGLQGVVEHLGEAVLDRLGRHAHPAGAVLHALRTKVLAQERGHVLLGSRCLRTLDHPPDHDEMLDHYGELGREAAMRVASLVDDARFDAGAFWLDISARLRDWHQDARSARHGCRP